MSVTWQQEVRWLTALHRMCERGDSVPVALAGTPYAFVGGAFVEMQERGLVAARASGFLHPTPGAEEVQGRIAIMAGLLRELSTFAAVNLTVELDEAHGEGDEAYPHSFDPRFQEPADEEEAALWSTEDLRLALITYLSGAVAASEEGRRRGIHEVDPRRVVFLQRLADGRLDDEHVWFDLGLGALARELEEIAEAAYRHEDVSDDPAEADVILRSMYTAGMLERRKREGRRCGACGIPLAAFELASAGGGAPLERCPNLSCGAALPAHGGGAEGPDPYDPLQHLAAFEVLGAPLF